MKRASERLRDLRPLTHLRALDARGIVMNKAYLQIASGADLAFSLAALSPNVGAADADNPGQQRGHGVLEGTWMAVVSSGPGLTRAC